MLRPFIILAAGLRKGRGTRPPAPRGFAPRARGATRFTILLVHAADVPQERAPATATYSLGSDCKRFCS
jgi:hypothetical protein